MICIYSKVQLNTNDFDNLGLKKGMKGYVIEVYNLNYYEVEFSDPKTGITLAQIVTTEDNLSLCFTDFVSS